MCLKNDDDILILQIYCGLNVEELRHNIINTTQRFVNIVLDSIGKGLLKDNYFLN